MPIISISLLANGTRGPRWDAEGTRTYTVVQDVITDGTMNEVQVVLDPLTVKPYVTFHPLDSYARCTSVDFEFDQDAHDYGILTSEFSTKLPGLAAELSGGAPNSLPGSGGDPATATRSENPLDRKPHVTVTTRMIKKLRQIDMEGTIIRNAAGDMYETTLVDVPHTCIEVERNLPDFNYNLINICNGACNETAFLGQAAQRIKCENLSAKDDWEKEVAFWRVRGTFIVGNTSDLVSFNVIPAIAGTVGWHWDWKINAGYYYLSGTKRVPIFLPGGQKPSRPQPLSADGTAVLAPNVAPNWRAFRNFRLWPLEELGLFN